MLNGVIGQPLKIGKFGSQHTSQEILKTIYQEGAILLNDVFRILIKKVVVGVSIPLPLLGFSYAKPNQVEMLRFSYSEYPYLDKRIVSNSMVKEQTKFSIVGYRPISLADSTSGNNVLVNFLTNELIYKTLDLYTSQGGTFTIITQWGIFNNLVLERFSGVNLDIKTMGGEGFLFEFKRVLFAKSLYQQMSDDLHSMHLGTLPFA